MKALPLLHLTLLALWTSCATTTKFSQDEVLNDLEIIDLSQAELVLLNQYNKGTKSENDQENLRRFYNQNTHLWEGYVGDEDEFVNWIHNKGLDDLATFNHKADRFDLKEMNKLFNKTAHEMANFTGYKPRGKWYIFWGPGWTDLGGFVDGSMLIDLGSQFIEKLSDATSAFPHELNHQIYTHTIPDKDLYNVISRVVDEGFACYVSMLFKEGSSAIHKELGYKKEEYNFCRANDRELIDLIRSNYNSTNDEEIDNLVNRYYTFKDDYPGAIGYYIGFRIVEEYVKRHGASSWKDIYTMHPEEVLAKSEIFN